jgi:hypothetical protein
MKCGTETIGEIVNGTVNLKEGMSSILSAKKSVVGIASPYDQHFEFAPR